MKHGKLLDTRDVALGDILVSGRLREARDHSVDALVASITQHGQALQPIMLREHKDELILIGGLHRLRAYQVLGRETIRADIWQGTDAWARLAEVDENLAGADLSTLELAMFLAERKRVYEKLHPQTKRGGDRKGQAFQDQNDTMSFCSSIAESRDISIKTVERYIVIGDNLDAEAAELLQNAAKPPGYNELADLVEHKPEQQRVAARYLAEGEAPTLKKAMIGSGVRKAPVKTASTEDTQFNALRDRFDRSSMEAKRRFVRSLFDDDADLLAEEAPAEFWIIDGETA